LLGVATPAGGSERDATKWLLEGVEDYELANGLRVILKVDRSLPQVALRIRYHAGAWVDPPGRAGLAHLCEHLMFRAPYHLEWLTPSAAYGEIGAIGVNAETHFTAARYSAIVPRDDLETALWLESDRMGFAVHGLTGSAFESERAIVAEERKQASSTPLTAARRWRSSAPCSAMATPITARSAEPHGA